MSKEQLKGVKMIIGGVVIAVGYFGYLLYEIRSEAQEIRVSLMLPIVTLLLIAVGIMQLAIGEKTTELMRFNTQNLSRRDILVCSIVLAGAIAVWVGMMLFFNSFGYL